jgi:hypothetical protein
LDGGGAIGNRLGEGTDLLIGEAAQVPVAGEAQLWKDDHLGSGGRGLLDEEADALQIGRFVTGKVLKLNGGDSNISHSALLVRFVVGSKTVWNRDRSEG